MPTPAEHLLDPSFWHGSLAEVDAAFDGLRRTPGLVRVEEPAVGALGPGPGSWAVTRHRDVAEISRRSDCFPSGNVADLGPAAPIWSAHHGTWLAAGDPRHHQAVRILSRARGRPSDGATTGDGHRRFRRAAAPHLTPRRAGAHGADVRKVADEVIDTVCEVGSCDLVADLAMRIPLLVLLDVLGIDRRHEAEVARCTRVVFGLSDPQIVSDQTDAGVLAAALDAGARLDQVVQQACAMKEDEPGNDVLSSLLALEAAGDLDRSAVVSLASTLVVAGFETTQSAIAHGVLLLAAHPEQREAWRLDPRTIGPTGVEEVLRVASPVSHFRRTCAADGIEVGGTEVRRGEHVVLWYRSANHDAEAFATPHRFDVHRRTSVQQAFGAPGAHHCIGANLARVEVRAALDAIVDRLPDLTLVGPVVPLRSTFLHGVRAAPVAFSPTPAGRR